MAPVAALLSALALSGFGQVGVGPDGGRLLSGTYPGTLRPGLLYLPPDYDPAHRYPVVYLLHGLPGAPTEYSDSLDLLAFADGAISVGAVTPFIAVVPAAGATARYGGEWAGPWESALVGDVVPFVDTHLATRADPAGRVLAGLSAGGFGAIDIGLRHPALFGTLESWSGYFRPLRDGPFADAGAATLAANDPTRLVRTEAAALRREGTRFFLSTGPAHNRLIDPASTLAFDEEADALGLPVTYRSFPSRAGEWRDQFDAGLAWALRP